MVDDSPMADAPMTDKACASMCCDFGSGLTVDDALEQCDTVLCYGHSTLLDAADLLIMHDRSAVGIADDRGELIGLITESDIARVCATGTSSHTEVATWLESGYACHTRQWVKAAAVSSSAPLAEASTLVSAESSGHHVVVRDSQGLLSGVLSSLDLARAVCRGCDHEKLMQTLESMAVADMMTSRDDLPVCCCSDTLAQVFARMAEARQSIALITDDIRKDGLVGIVTHRDALRAFAEHVSTRIEVGHWLRAMQGSAELRQVDVRAQLSEVATAMAAGAVHHLAVLAPTRAEVVGMVSSLDLAQVVASM